MLNRFLPQPTLYMLRCHSFYTIHSKEVASIYPLGHHDQAMLKWVNLFSPYHLYAKNAVQPDSDKLNNYHESLVKIQLALKLKS